MITALPFVVSLNAEDGMKIESAGVTRDICRKVEDE